VDEVLPPAARETGRVSLRWLGFEPCGWLTALVGMNRARSCAEFRQASRPWLVPTFNVVFADVLGHIGFQSVGRIPVRAKEEHGYRPGWDPEHQWAGLVPFDAMPHLTDPPRGFIITGNNRLAPADYPYPLSGRWSMGYRARRIRTRIEAGASLTREDSQALQLDTYSGRAARCVPHLVRILAGSGDARIVQAVRWLEDWDCRVEPGSVAAALFNVFFLHWCRIVSSARFPPETAAFAAASAWGLAADLLEKDNSGWFADEDRQENVIAAFVRALSELTERLGPDMSRWHWGRLHVLAQKHFLSGRGELGQLLDRSGIPVRGDGTTVNNSTSDPSHAAAIGAGYRMVADLADPAPGFWAVEVAGASGHPGSPHYDDQIEPWSAGEYHSVDFDGRPKSGRHH
jgi:penicillin amidase